MRFTSRQRLRRTAEFQAVRSNGRQRVCGTFVFSIRLRPENEAPVRRLGVIASRRVGNAVARNRAKRRLRELFRRHQENLPLSCDVVLIARRSLIAESFAATEGRILKAFRGAHPRPETSCS